MRVLHVVQGMEMNSGVAVFVSELADAQVELGLKSTVLCSYHPDLRPKVAELRCVNGSDEFDLSEFDVVHLHALWSLYMLRWIKRCCVDGVPYVISPHGCLMPRVFTRGRLKKWIFWHCFLKPFVRQATAFHCTSVAEKSAVHKLLGSDCPSIIVAPLGVHLPELSENTKINTRTVLFLGRLGEEKGLVKLLEAWNRVKRNGWRLVLAGPDWEGYKQVLLDKCRNLALPYVQASNSLSSQTLATPYVVFEGPVEGESKANLYRTADIFVLPSPMENFSHVVLEALSYGVPVIATNGTPWQELERAHGGFWIDQGVEPLAEALVRLMTMNDELRLTMGKNGRKLVADKYQWGTVAKCVLDAYMGGTRCLAQCVPIRL